MLKVTEKKDVYVGGVSSFKLEKIIGGAKCLLFIPEGQVEFNICWDEILNIISQLQEIYKHKSEFYYK